MGLAFFRAYYEKLPEEVAHRLTEIDAEAVGHITRATGLNPVSYTHLATFPSLTDEQKALIENIWFDHRFAANLGTIEMLYEKFEEVAEGRGWESYPSIKTVARYIKHLMDSRGAESARYLAANGSREWKNKKMLKGKRDATCLLYTSPP